MKKLLSVLVLLGVVSANAEQYVSSAAVLSSTYLSIMRDCKMNPDSCKVLVEAKDDAAEFLATNGEIRSAKLQAAFDEIRENRVNINASDLQLAEAILSYE